MCRECGAVEDGSSRLLAGADAGIPARRPKPHGFTRPSI